MPVSASSHSQLRGSGASLPTPQGIQEPSLKATKDAFRYLDLVKSKLAAQPQLYLDFLDIMQKFKKQTIDIHDMLKQVSNLFKEVPELIVALSRFLPPGNKVEVQKMIKDMLPRFQSAYQQVLQAPSIQILKARKKMRYQYIL